MLVATLFHCLRYAVLVRTYDVFPFVASPYANPYDAFSYETSPYDTSPYDPSFVLYLFTSPYISSLNCGVPFIAAKTHWHGKCVNYFLEFIDFSNVPKSFRKKSGNKNLLINFLLFFI